MRIEYPFSKAFLKQLIALVLKDSGYGLRVIRSLDPALIPGETNQILFSALKQGSEVGTVPTRTVVEQLLWQKYQSGAFKRDILNQAVGLLRESVEIGAVSRNEAYPILKDALLQANIGSALDESLNKFKKREYDEIKDIVNLAYDNIRLLELGDPGYRASLHIDQRIAQIRSGIAKVERLPFGLPDLDIRLKGGLGRGELGCILAGQKIGKSMVLVWIAQTCLLAGLKVTYITLELDKDTVKARIEAGLVDLETDEIENGGNDPADIIEQNFKPLLQHGDLVVKHFPGGMLTTAKLEMFLRDNIDLWSYEPDVLIVDYADKMALGKGERYEALGDLYSDLRSLGVPRDSYSGTGMKPITERGMAVWTASQIKTSAINHTHITLWDAAGSYLKGAEVDLMLAICCTDEEFRDNMFRLYLATSRFAGGGRGELDEYGPYFLDYKHGRILAHEGSRFSKDFQPRMGLNIDVDQLFGNLSTEKSAEIEYEIKRKIETENMLIEICGNEKHLIGRSLVGNLDCGLLNNPPR